MREKGRFLLTLIDAACLALTKAPMLHSRYFLVFVPVIDVFVMTGAHAVLKKMLVRSRYTKGIQSLVGVVTTQENASPILEELKKDWSKRVTGLAILEAAPGQLHTEIDGVKYIRLDVRKPIDFAFLSASSIWCHLVISGSHCANAKFTPQRIII